MSAKTKQFEGKLLQAYSEVYYYVIDIPAEIAHFYKDLDVKRLCLTMNDTITVQCGIMSGGNDTYYINTNKKVVQQLKLKHGDNIHCVMSPDTSKYGVPMPREMEEALAIDPLGDAYFHKLTPGKQRSLLYLVDKLKSEDKRIEKSIIILQHLVANKGLLDYKALNQAFKKGIDI